jgi:hypothetical protein
MWELPFQPLELFWNASLTSEKEKQKLIYYINEENKKKKEKKYQHHVTVTSLEVVHKLANTYV